MYRKEKAKLLSSIPESLQTVLEETKSFIAGGAITSLFCNRDIVDYDIYVPDKKAAVAIAAWAFGEEEYTYDTEGSHSGILSSVTDKSITFTAKDTQNHFQVILFEYFKTAEDIFKLFDFTVCMGAYSFENGEFILHGNFLKDNSQRRLSFNPNTKYPYVSALRVDKYKHKGYTISKAEFMRVLLACSKKDINSWKELAEQMAGLYGCFSEDIFPTEKECNLENIFDALADIEIPSQPTTLGEDKFSFLELVKHIHGDVPVGDKESPFREGFYYKKVLHIKDGVGASIHTNAFLYRVGEKVNGGPVGIFIDNDPNMPYWNSRSYFTVELKPCEGAEVKTNINPAKSVIIGDVEVVRMFYYDTKRHPLLDVYLTF